MTTHDYPDDQIEHPDGCGDHYDDFIASDILHRFLRDNEANAVLYAHNRTLSIDGSIQLSDEEFEMLSRLLPVYPSVPRGGTLKPADKLWECPVVGCSEPTGQQHIHLPPGMTADEAISQALDDPVIGVWWGNDGRGVCPRCHNEHHRNGICATMVDWRG
jgi:hypothetical protein